MLASEDAFVDRIDAYVDARDFTSALWWSERIYAAAPSIENLLRLAQIHLQSNKPCRTYGLLKGYQAQIDPRNEDSLRLDRRRRFLFAQACFELGQFRDAEISLIEGFSGTNPSAMDINLMPNGASGFHLLGQICMKQNRRCQALAYFQRCIEMDSFHWSAYAAMCQMGAALPNSCRLEIQECESIVPSEPLAAPFAPKPAFLASQPLTPGATQFSAPYQTPSAPIGFLTPQTNLPKPSFSSICVETPPLKTEVKVGTTPFRKPPLGSIRKVHSRLGRDATPVTKTPRRSERLSFSTLTDLTSDPDRAQRSSRRSARLEKRITDRGSSVNHPGQNGAMSRSCLKALSHAVTTTTEAYRLLCNFQCNEAIAVMSRLPESQFQTSWVLIQLGRAYFELNDYQKSCEMFEAARRIEPYNLTGIDIYSTALWQLKQEVKLAFLAQHASEVSRLSAETWVAIGNCFSLQKEHDTAIKFFHRAIQIDANYAYAHTLASHEYIANEDFDKAIAGFRNAIRIDDRHYNAWYGLGTIYYRQEKFDLSVYHFVRAIKINSRNSVLECYLGMVLHANKKFSEALVHLDRSCALEPANLLPKFQKANVLASMENYDQALEELQQLADAAPREASVYFMMGKMCKKRGELLKALMHFTTCLDLDPKDGHLVKNGIDKLHSAAAQHSLDDLTDEDEL